uniref:50S ribosomal protein L33 n=1 Tax=Chromera velia CCMP2878 TaxID=1169474 RepID=A0A0G4HEY7_9ALVE|eukprot:Cvel_26774.t1-p1 / transcript=Cvel_26774.t1 / gene=Cvel_26774 / organism=Chromera_velia_CCMP2878 / gene_product=hypothetical protein / transcript_product=hypothetical protein / location=Cvel_scaffold3238:968-1750(-) / protein_length=127 / sequence_SO=supercontig / SO=protein_coding / is_pseudo=false
MLSLSRPVLSVWNNSRRLLIYMLSSAQTGSYRWMNKSPTKKAFRFSIRKYDRAVRRHVIYFESRRPQAKTQLNRWKKKHIYSTGEGIEPFVQLVKRRWEMGRYNPYFSKQMPRLVDRMGRGTTPVTR